MRELILEEQSQARKKQKRKHRYGQCLNSCACDGSHYFQASLMVKVVNEKKLEKTLNHTQYMYMLQKIPLFFSSMAEAVPGYYSFSLHGSIH